MLRKSITLLISTVKHMRNINQLFLIPLTIWSGLEQSFLGAQFTKVDQIKLNFVNSSFSFVLRVLFLVHLMLNMLV